MTLRILLGVAVLASASIAHADVELKNDAFVSGGSAGFQTGFVSGEAGAARFVAPAANRQLRKIQLLWGGATATQPATLKIFDDTAGTDAPGAELYMTDVELTGADDAMQELDLTPANVYVTEKFRIAIFFQHAGAPTLATDSDGNGAADKNFIYAQGMGWKKASALGVTGDWVIRAFVSDASGPGPVGTFCDTNAECPSQQYCDVPHHACTFDCQGDTDCNGGTCDDLGQCHAGSKDDGGCQASGGGNAAGALLGAGGLAMLVQRRRRR